MSEYVKESTKALHEAARRRSILDAAADLIVRHGYDKTTMGDIADAVGLGRGLVYLHFKSKDELLEALIAREMRRYGQAWMDHIEADAQGGTVGGIHRSILHALQQTPFLAAIVTRQEHTFGKYLRKPGNLFEGLQTPSGTRDLLQALQTAGVVRPEVDLAAMAYIMDLLATSLVGLGEAGGPIAPPYEALMETVAEMLDRMLTPADGGNRAAGKAVLRQFAGAAAAQMEQWEQQRAGAPAP